MTKDLYTWFKSKNWPLSLYRAFHEARRLANGSINRTRLRSSKPIRPVFITGSGRCGTTLMRRILQSGGEIHFPPENHRLPTALLRFLRSRRRSWDEIVDIVLASFEYDHTYKRYKVPLAPLAKTLKKVDKSEQNFARIINDFYIFHGKENGNNVSRWGDKTILHASWLEPLKKVFPQAYFIHMLRDGVDASSSLRKVTNSSLETAAGYWKMRVAACLAFENRYPDQVITVRYEDLVRNPEPEVRKACNLTGLNYRRHMIEDVDQATDMRDVQMMSHHERVKKPIDNSAVGKWRSKLTPSERKLLAKELDSMLKRLGYNPLTSSA